MGQDHAAAELHAPGLLAGAAPRPARPEPDKALAAFERNLDILEARLGDGPWLLGRDFTLADIEVGLPLYRYFTVEIARRDRPALAAYYARSAERPAYAAHVMVPYDILRQMTL